MRDKDDNDWGGQAAIGNAQTVAEYHRLNKEEMIVLFEWYQTKDEAFQAVISRIDELLAKS